MTETHGLLATLPNASVAVTRYCWVLPGGAVVSVNCVVLGFQNGVVMLTVCSGVVFSAPR